MANNAGWWQRFTTQASTWTKAYRARVEAQQAAEQAARDAANPPQPEVVIGPRPTLMTSRYEQARQMGVGVEPGAGTNRSKRKPTRP